MLRSSMVAILNVVIFVVALWGLPKEADASHEGPNNWRRKWHQVKNDIGWIGAIIASSSLAMLSYVFACVYLRRRGTISRQEQHQLISLSTITGSTSDIEEPSSIALLSIAVALIPAFIFWVGRQERLGRPAIIPNSLWRNKIFTTICIAVFLTWGAFNALETILTFYFQKVQLLSATQTSLRFLPSPVSGVLANVAMGLIVHRVPANWLVVVATIISCLAPLTMVSYAYQNSDPISVNHICFRPSPHRIRATGHLAFWQTSSILSVPTRCSLSRICLSPPSFLPRLKRSPVEFSTRSHR